jgi:hypothetical protein
LQKMNSLETTFLKKLLFENAKKCLFKSQTM